MHIPQLCGAAWSSRRLMVQLTNGQHTCELVFKPKADILNICHDYQFVFSVLEELYVHTMLDAAGVVLRVHYKSMKCDVKLWSQMYCHFFMVHIVLNIKYYCFCALSSPCGSLNNKAACFNAALHILLCTDCIVLVNAFLFTTSTTHGYLTVADLPETHILTVGIAL